MVTLAVARDSFSSLCATVLDLGKVSTEFIINYAVTTLTALDGLTPTVTSIMTIPASTAFCTTNISIAAIYPSIGTRAEIPAAAGAIMMVR